MATTAERLALVEAAIDKLLVDGLASWTVLNRTFTRANLTELRRLELDLRSQLQAETRRGARRLYARPV